MLKLKVQGEPGHIARLTELLESLEDDIEIVNASDLQKWSADAQWADCYIILRLKGEASPMVAPTVKVREKRAKRGAKTKEVDRSGYVYLLKTSGGVYKIGQITPTAAARRSRASCRMNMSTTFARSEQRTCTSWKRNCTSGTRLGKCRGHANFSI
jgi:hypothetical protein